MWLKSTLLAASGDISTASLTRMIRQPVEASRKAWCIMPHGVIAVLKTLHVPAIADGLALRLLAGAS